MAQTETVPPWTLGNRLERALDFAGVSVGEMARELGVSRSTVSRWLNDRGTPTRGYLTVWAQRTGVPRSWLADGENNDPLPRVGSNHQPADMNNDLRIPWLAQATHDESVPQSRNAADLLAMRKALPITRRDLHHSADAPSPARVTSQ